MRGKIKIISIFLLLLCCSCFSQEQGIIEYKFNSTSPYLNSQRGGEYIYYDTYEQNTPMYKAMPRRAIGYDDDDINPGYNPSDPATPVGDLEPIDIVLFLGLTIVIMKLKDLKIKKA